MNTTQRFKYSSTDVALVMIDSAIRHHIVLNNTKVQKLLFILYALSLVTNGERLVNESPKAWPYGPVFPTVRKRILKWGINLEDFHIADNTDKLEDKEILSDRELSAMCDSLMTSKFATMTSSQLVAWTHIKGSPWDMTTHSDNFKWGEPISDGLIIDYYGQKKN